MRSLITTKTRVFALSALFCGGFCATQPASAEISGEVGVVSDYIFRGYSQNLGRSVAVQGGLTYDYKGFYASYWGSTVDFGGTQSGAENDLILGYSGSAGDISYGVGVIGYLYTGGSDMDDNNTAELTANVGYGPVALDVYYALEDAAWTNSGDTYVALSASFPLPKDFTLDLSAGWYFYDEEGEYLTGGTDSSNFSDATISLSHPLPFEGGSMSVNYTFTGTDRYGEDVGGDNGSNAWLGVLFAF